MNDFEFHVSTIIVSSTINNDVHFLLGQSGKLDLIRDGDVYMNLLYDQEYNYETPMVYTFDPPLLLMLGDEPESYMQLQQSGWAQEEREHRLLRGGHSGTHVYCFITLPSVLYF